MSGVFVKTLRAVFGLAFLAAFAALVAFDFLYPNPLGYAAQYGALFFAAFCAAQKILGRAQPLRNALLGIFGSIALLASLVYVASLAIGYGALSVAIGFALSCAVFVFLSDFLSGAFSGVALLLADCLKNIPALCLCLAVFAAVLALNCHNLWVPSPQGIVVGGWNYGDFFFHLPIILTVNAGNFPPTTPSLYGAPLVYHWFSDFVTAFNAKSTGLDAVFLVRIENAAYVAAFVLCSYLLALFALNDRKKALYACVLILFAGGLGFTRIFGDVAAGGNPLSLVVANAYDNDWKTFQMPSLLAGFLMPQRGMAFALPVFCLLLSLILEGLWLGSREHWLVAGAVAGLCFPFHFYIVPAVALAALCGLCVEFFSAKPLRALSNGVAFAVPLLAFCAPFALWLLSSSGFSSHPVLSLGWLAPSDLLGATAFYFLNLGVFPFACAFVLLSCVLGWWDKSDDGRRRNLSFLSLCGLALFAIPNIVSLGQVDWDLNKFFAFMFVPAGIACTQAAFFAADCLRGHKAAFLAAFILFCSLSSGLTMVWWSQSGWVGLTNAQIAAGNWIASNTPQGSVFIAHSVHNSPIDSIAARFRVRGYEGSSWLNSIGGINSGRRMVVDDVYCGHAEDASAAAKSLGASYVYFGYAEREEYSKFSCTFPFRSSPLFPIVYSQDGIGIYKVQ